MLSACRRGATRWNEGDHLGNIQSLIDVVLESLAHHVPEIRRARYDFDRRAFVTGQGQPITDRTLDEWSNSHPRIRAAGAGSATPKRGILLNTLAQTTGREEPGLLERVLHLPDQLVTGTSLEKGFYSVRRRAQQPGDLMPPPETVREAW
jgi:hypothetical protein